MINMLKEFFRHYLTKLKIKKDENFLMREGLRKAKEQKLEIKIGEEYVLELNSKEGEIYLPESEDGIDARKLVSFVADDYPEITKRYLENRKKLGM